MTNEEKDRQRAAKVEVTQWLRGVNLERYRLDEVDERLTVYCRSVIDSPEGHNLFEQLAVRHFLNMVEKYGLCQTEVWRFFKFYEMLYFPGKVGLRHYRLTPVQCLSKMVSE